MPDELAQSCADSHNWPLNFGQIQFLHSVLEYHDAQLQAHRERLFINADKSANVRVIEALAGCSHMKAHLDQHLVGKEKDPRVRYLFMSASHSQAPLSCRFEMFRYLCTYHQVSPEAVGLLYSFGPRNNGLNDFHHTHLIQEYWDQPSSPTYSIPDLGRSGRSMRIGYKLAAMEKSDFDGEWTMRETVIYHTLDMSNGKLLWITVKANDLIRDRIIEAREKEPTRLHSIPTTVQASLEVVLSTHMIVLEWCTEGWRWYISQMESRIRDLLVKTTSAPINSADDVLDPIPSLVRALSLPTSESIVTARPLPKINGTKEATFSESSTAYNNDATNTSAFNRQDKLREPSKAVMDRQSQVQLTIQQLAVLNDFKLKDLQTLGSVSKKVREAKLAMTMNVRILQELLDCYQNIFNTKDLSTEAFEACQLKFGDFQRCVKTLRCFLESECLGASTLLEQLDDGRNLYDRILESQTTKIQKLFAMSQHDSSMRMENLSQQVKQVTDSMHDIAKHTEKDTSSMHVITLFTLVFLPGTFLGTFFSTGIIGVGENGGPWLFNMGLFELFIEICLPMMLITLGFRAFLHDCALKGLDCAGNDAYYLSNFHLLQFWTHAKIRQLFERCNQIVDVDTIRDNYVQVLSILVAMELNGPPSIHHIFSIMRSQYDDSSLPWERQPRQVFDGRDGVKTFEDFQETQWKFHPIIIELRNRLSNSKLNKKCIFPFSRDEKHIGGGRSTRDATVQIMNVHEQAHAHLGVQSSQVPRKIVLKTYPPTKKDGYDDERRAYLSLQNGTDRGNILRCFGSYYWASNGSDCTSVIVLEYAEKTLLDLYGEDRPPVEFEDIKRFWRSFLGIITGTEIVHNPTANFVGVHQDLKPSNIFVFEGDAGFDKHDYRFKIRDFGSTHVASSHQGLSIPDTASMRAYGPPELQLNDVVDYKVDPDVDIWALGCILLEAAVWVSFGEHQRQAFRLAREQETELLFDHWPQGRSDCFHDGVDALQIVRAMGERVQKAGRRCDLITTQIVDYVLSVVLIPKEQRRDNIRQILTKLGNMFYQAKEPHFDPSSFMATIRRNSPAPMVPLSTRARTVAGTLNPIYVDKDWKGIQPKRLNGSLRHGVPVSSATQRELATHTMSVPECDRENASPAASQAPHPISNGISTLLRELDRTTLSPVPTRSFNIRQSDDLPTTSINDMRHSYPEVSIEDLEAWIKAKKTKPAQILKGWKAAKNELYGRDIIILVDNSRFMQSHLDFVARTVKALAYLSKELDPDGIEVACTSNPRKIVRCRSSTQADDFVRENFRTGHESDCNIEMALETIVDPIKQKLMKRSSHWSHLAPFQKSTLRPVSIYVLTDGHWDESAGGICGADKPIESLINAMRQGRVGRTQASLQFVRFGDDPRRMRRLDLLDDELGERSQNRD
ncbi:hypothetical protein SCUP234_02823 [Seiridium cupressi]